MNLVSLAMATGTQIQGSKKVEPKALESSKKSKTTRVKGSQPKNEKVRDSNKQNMKSPEVLVKKQEEKSLETLGNKQTGKPQGAAAKKEGMGIGANT